MSYKLEMRSRLTEISCMSGLRLCHLVAFSEQISKNVPLFHLELSWTVEITYFETLCNLLLVIAWPYIPGSGGTTTCLV